MPLETEFRIYCQLLSILRGAESQSLARLSHPTRPDVASLASIWVNLRPSPGALPGEQALLLCQASEREWVAWIPDYGEVLLDRDAFLL